MTDRYVRERIENWAGDFVSGDRARRFPGGVREVASEVLTTLLVAACDARGEGPAEVEREDLRQALLGPVAGLGLPESVRREVPDLCAAFLEELEAEGRLGGGRELGLSLRALRGPFLAAASGRGVTDRRPAPKIGSNDPCPCGSGRKYKKCCQGERLG